MAFGSKRRLTSRGGRGWAFYAQRFLSDENRSISIRNLCLRLPMACPLATAFSHEATRTSPHVLEAGAQRHFLCSQEWLSLAVASKDFPSWKTVYHHFRCWSRSGLLECINTRLRRLLRRLDGKNKEPSAAVIDSQSVRSNAHGGPVGYDAGKKTKGRKRFVCVDTLGWLLGVTITPANITERCGAKELLRPVLRGHRLKKI